MNKRFSIVFLLGFSSGLPLALLSTTLQAWFASSDLPIFLTSMLSLIGLPYIYRLLWGPLLDRYSLFRLGKRRSWILSTQCLLILGFNLMSWLTPTTSPWGLALLAFVLAHIAATQDMVIEAHRTEYLLPKEQGLGASLAVLGYRIAFFISSGIALIMAQYLGWAITYRLIGFLLLFGILGTILSPEPSLKVTETQSLLKTFYEPIQDLLKKPNVISLFCFIIFYKLGEAFTATTSGIVMPFLIQGLGFSLETIGYINKIVGILAIISGGITAGFLLMRWTLFRALMIFGLFQALSNILFVILACVGKNITMLFIAVLFDNFAAGLGSTAVVVLIMRVVNKKYTATQFSVLATIAAVPRVLSGPFAATLQSWLGWVGVYETSVLLAILFIPFLIKINSIIPIEDQKVEATSIAS